MTNDKIFGSNSKNAPRADRGYDYRDYRGTATESEFQPFKNGAVSLGRYLHPNGKLGAELFSSQNLLKRHSLVVGRTGVGKTESIIKPWVISLLKQGASVVVVDVLGNLYQELSQTAKELGVHLWYWNSSDLENSGNWNWLRELDLNDEDQLEAAITSILGKPPTDEKMSFHYHLEAKWLRALIPMVKHIFGAGVEPQHLYRLVANQNYLRKALKQHPDLEREYEDELNLLLSADGYEYLKMMVGLEEKLNLFKQKSVAQISRKSDFSLCDIDRQPTLLIIGDKLNNQRAGTLTSLMINYLFSHVYNRLRGRGNTQIPLYFILDEAPRLKTKIDFAEITSVGRAANVGICLAAQDVTQFGSERETMEILVNCNTIITTKGVGPDSAKFLSRMLGKRKVPEATFKPDTLRSDIGSIDRGESLLWILLKKLFANITSTRYIDVPVLGDREIMYPPMGKYPGIVLAPPVCSKPILVELNTACRTI